MKTITSKSPSSKGGRTARRILEAACLCIGDVGIEKTSITAIAHRAKVSRALVAHHFPKKAEVFQHVIQYIAQEGYRSIELMPSGDRGLEQLEHVVSANLNFFIDHPQYFRCFFLFYYYASIRREFREMNTLMQHRAVSRFVQILTSMGEKSRRMVDANGLSEMAQRLQRELISGIQYYYILTHDVPAASYKRKVQDSVVKMAMDFMETLPARPQ